MTREASPPSGNIVVRLRFRQIVLLLIGLLTAGAATGVTAVVLSAAWQAPIRLAAGESTELDGLRITNIGIERTEVLVDSAGEPVRPPEDATVVVLRYRIEMLDAGAAAPVYCRAELTDEYRRWPPDLHWMGRAQLTEAGNCAGTPEQRLAPDQPVTVATVFVIPGEAEQLSAELAVGESTLELAE